MYGNILRLIRIANDNMSVKNAAINIKVASTYICDLEKDRKNPSLNMLEKFSRLYDIPVSKIILFDELQKKNNLNNQEILKMILEYYLFEKNSAVESVKKK